MSGCVSTAPSARFFLGKDDFFTVPPSKLAICVISCIDLSAVCFTFFLYLFFSQSRYDIRMLDCYFLPLSRKLIVRRQKLTLTTKESLKGQCPEMDILLNVLTFSSVPAVRADGLQDLQSNFNKYVVVIFN